MGSRSCSPAEGTAAAFERAKVWPLSPAALPTNYTNRTAAWRGCRDEVNWTLTNKGDEWHLDRKGDFAFELRMRLNRCDRKRCGRYCVTPWNPLPSRSDGGVSRAAKGADCKSAG